MTRVVVFAKNITYAENVQNMESFSVYLGVKSLATSLI